MTVVGRRPSIPSELAGLAEIPILAGEDRRQFEALRWMITDEVRPKTALQWLLCLDLVEQSWEILRYRRLKQSVLATRREEAIKAILQRIDGAGMRDQELAEVESAKSAAAWRSDKIAAVEVEQRLFAAGYQTQEIDAEVYVQAEAALSLLDRLMHSAQTRRLTLMRQLLVGR